MMELLKVPRSWGQEHPIMRVCDRIQADFDGLVLVAAGAPIPATDLAQQAGLAELVNVPGTAVTTHTKPLVRSR